jgi:hypothetical protein
MRLAVDVAFAKIRFVFAAQRNRACTDIAIAQDDVGGEDSERINAFAPYDTPRRFEGWAR